MIYDDERDVFEVVRAMLAEVYHVTEQTLDDKNEIGFHDRVLTERLRIALEAQEASRFAAYRCRAKAAQHVDHSSAGSQDVDRVMQLITAESIKIMETFEGRIGQRIDELQRQDGETSRAQVGRMQHIRTNAMASARHRQAMHRKTREFNKESGARSRKAQTSKRACTKLQRRQDCLGS
ncbi:MAG: hypothetical protein SGPRY_010443 [Prymnesium sp.]